MKSSKVEQSNKYGPPKELFELALALDEADLSISKCLSIMQNSKADPAEQQQDAFLKIFEVIANAQNYLCATNEYLNTRPLKLLLREWADINEGAKPKFTNIKSKKAKQGGRPILVEMNHARALLVAAVKIKINQGLKVGEAEKQVSTDTGIKPSTLRAWRSDFGRKDGPPKDITELANRLEKYGNPTQQYENLINQFNANKIV